MVRGSYNPKLALPLVPLSDGAGEVIEVGPGVARVRTGDRVTSCFFQGWSAGPVPPDGLVHRTALGGPLDGMLAEEVVLAEDGVAPFPAHLSYEEAATLPCAALTAYSALFRHGALAPGQTVLVQGTGGVALFALQLARLAGARVIALTSSEEKAGRLRALGADEVIDRARVPAWGAEVRRLSGGAGVDVVVEVGGAGTLEQSLRAVRAGGTIAVIGVLSGPSRELSVTAALMHEVRLQGVLVGSRADLLALGRAVALHRLRPVIDAVFPLEDARAAFERLASGAHFGKLAVRL
jgi:NADPH:quinone reductase-like Zn-dependent oxidoreductase